MGRLAHLLRELDPDKVRRGKQLERLIKWWLTADPVYTAQVRRVWLWDEWPGRWGPDCGIDLVAEAKDGGLWAIQTRAYAPETSATKASVDAFLAESNREEFAFHLLVATTDRIARNPEHAIEGQEKRVGIVRRSDLEAPAVVWPRSIERLGAPAPLKRRRPRYRGRPKVRPKGPRRRPTETSRALHPGGPRRSSAVGVWTQVQERGSRGLERGRS